MGPYELLRVIGEGGFGVVFEAEQVQPIARRVALKIVKLGMDTRQVVARFEQERQALALMDHPHIARALDAGSTETGRPHFLMDLVQGQPISEFCDAQRLSNEPSAAPLSRGGGLSRISAARRALQRHPSVLASG
ncbi:MAG: protein kinase [Planctomycetes bacterium]|nr:protein kinase [Planctomycetota bacterium]